MATQKGLCPYCQTQRFDRRIFQVNAEAKTCFCPTCMKEMEPHKAIEGYRNHIQKMLSVADNTLFVTCDPSLAYHQYASVIELEPNEVRALLGRILCLLYMGRVRKSYISEAYVLLENTKYDGTNLEDFVLFLKKINFALDEYNEGLKKKLTFKDRFYDLDCLKLYLSHFYDIIKLKQLVFATAKSIKRGHDFRQIDVAINLFEHDLDEKTTLLKKPFYVVDGHSYLYERIYNGRVFVSEGKKKSDNKFSRYRLCSLNEKDKSKKYIKDEIFKDYTRTIAANKVSLAVSILLYLCSGGLLASGIIFKENMFYLVSFVACAGLLFILATVAIATHFYWRALLKRRKLRVD